MTSKSNTSTRASGKVGKPSPTKSETILGIGAVIDGDLTSEGNIHVDGTVRGDVTAKGIIRIGSSGEVEGELEAESVHVGGIARGNINAEAISVYKTGRIWGDLTTISLSTEEGGFIQGVVTMQRKESPKPKKQAKKVDELPPELEAQVVEAISKKSSKK